MNGLTAQFPREGERITQDDKQNHPEGQPIIHKKSLDLKN
jgi:hypothetical protein